MSGLNDWSDVTSSVPGFNASSDPLVDMHHYKVYPSVTIDLGNEASVQIRKPIIPVVEETKENATSGLNKEDFSQYKAAFTIWIKNYKTDEYNLQSEVEKQKRLEIFGGNLKKIDSLNEANSPTKFGLNEYSDLTWDEFKVRLHSYAPERVPKVWIGNQSERDIEKLKEAKDLCRTLSLRNDVTPVKNQGNCSAGWAFAAVAVAEARFCQVKKTTMIFSKQQILDSVDDGCEGGDVRHAFGHFQDYGVPTEEAYPYKGVNGALKKGIPLTRLDTMKDLPRDEFRMAYSLRDGGPFAVTFKVGPSFQFYKSGILSVEDWDPKEKLWHSVAVVGFGREYWEIKNSFGTSWGEEGFGRVKRGTNWCNIEDGPTTGWFN